MGSYLKSFAAELLPAWLKARREGKDAPASIHSEALRSRKTGDAVKPMPLGRSPRKR